MGKPTSKSTKVSKPEANRPSVKSRSDNKQESKVESKSESNGTKKLRKDECEDSSVLHPSIDLSVSGLRQISKIFENGTKEIQDLLSFECDVIYECKICRNLFRSVANFISHKRVYCTTQYQTSNRLLNLNNKLEEDCSSIDPADAVHPNVIKTKLKNPNRISPRSNLAAVLNSRVSLHKPGYIRSNIHDLNSNGDHSMLLQTMQSSNAGVFQTFVPNSSSGYPMLMRDQLHELYSSQPRTETIDIDLVNGDDNSSEFMNGISDFESNKTYTCDYCGLPCSSAKSLLRHKKLIHETAKTCYLCPCCKSTFPNTWSVHRHLFKVHHKTNEQVRKLRLQIKSKVLQPGEMVKALPDKMKLAQQKITDQQKYDLENEEWLDHLGKDVDLLRCGSCGRKFERRAALKAHYQICQKRVVNVNSTAHYRATPENEINSSDSKPKSITENLKLLPVVALTALTPAQIKEKSYVPEKKIGIQVRMDYCKNSSSNSLADAVTERSDRLSEFDKPNPIEVITIDDTMEKPKSCLEALLTGKRNNRSDSGNDSESQDDASIALDFSSDSAVDEDAIKLNMYDILGISSTDSNTENAFDNSLNMESTNCDEFSNGSTVIPNKRKKACPVKRPVFNTENDSKSDSNRSEVWSEKSNDLDCVFRRENIKVTYANCKLKRNKTESEKVNHFNDPPNPFCPELVEKLSNYYNKTNGICLLCNNQFDPVSILRHITEHGNWSKFRCKWPQCQNESSTKAELIKHISKDHKSLNGEIIAHDFVELISRKDWKFIVAVSTNNYQKKCKLLEKVSKLKERLNGSGKLSEVVISEETTNVPEISVTKVDENPEVVSHEEIKGLTEEVDTKVELMEVDISLNEIDTVDLNSSVDDKDCEISSAKLSSEIDQVENSSHCEMLVCDSVDSDCVSQMNDVNKVNEVVCDESEALLEAHIGSTVELNEEAAFFAVSENLEENENSPVASGDSGEKEASPVTLGDSGEKEASPVTLGDSGEKKASPVTPSDLNEEEASPITPSDSNEEEASPITPSDSNKEEAAPVTPSNSNEEEASSVTPLNWNEEEASSVTPSNLNEEETSPATPLESSNIEVSPVIPVDLNDENTSLIISVDLTEEEVPVEAPENLIEVESSPFSPVDLDEEEVSPAPPADLSEEEASPAPPADLSEEEASPFIPIDSNEEVTSPKSSTDWNEEDPLQEASSVLEEEKAVASPAHSTTCDSPATVYEDDLMNESHCEDISDADPSSSVFDKSEMEVELDDDHLRAVMMEMIFGQPSDEASNPTSEFVAGNGRRSRKRKLIDTELNV